MNKKIYLIAYKDVGNNDIYTKEIESDSMKNAIKSLPLNKYNSVFDRDIKIIAVSDITELYK